MNTRSIGFVGLGNLGRPIAMNLLKAGYKVRVFNRTREKLSTIVAAGAEAVQRAHETAEKGGIVITLVADDEAVKTIASDDFAAALGPGGIHVSMSTISPHAARDLAMHHKKFGATYMAAPVFARPEAAAAKAGIVCVSGGSAAERQLINGILTDGVAKQVVDFGDEPGAAHVVKLVGNFMLAASIEMMAEAFVLAEKNGLSAQGVYEMFTSTIFSLPVFQNYGKLVVQRSFEPASFRLALGLKDINLVLDAAHKTKTPMPLADLLQERLQKSMGCGEGHLDWSAFSKRAAEDAGLGT
ncbi:MAG TPA: NAD(P)-dependent oxidoreductase [Ohtaekwangia sp.]|nr:NAD(P)-dependent oxidoreductase [Ohtaekwangia sp.]